MTPGTTISHYRIVDPLGRDGIGIIYTEDFKPGRLEAHKSPAPEPDELLCALD